MQEITRETFGAEVVSSPVPVLVDFWGPQCGPCMALLPAVEALARQYDGTLKVVKVEAPKNRRLCIDQKVMSLPTFLLYAEGREVARMTGDVTRQQLYQAVAQLTEHEGSATGGSHAAAG